MGARLCFVINADVELSRYDKTCPPARLSSVTINDFDSQVSQVCVYVRFIQLGILRTYIIIILLSARDAPFSGTRYLREFLSLGGRIKTRSRACARKV